MPMTVAIPTNLEPFVQKEIATGAVGSEQELVTRALELYCEMRQRHGGLKAEVDRSLAEAARGEVADLDIEATISRGVERLASRGITD